MSRRRISRRARAARIENAVYGALVALMGGALVALICAAYVMKAAAVY